MKLPGLTTDEQIVLVKRNNMKWLPVLLLIMFTQPAVAQTDSITLLKAVTALDKALVTKDSSQLALLLDKRLSYGHSNGWVQSKSEVWADFVSGKVVYSTLQSSDIKLLTQDKDGATLVLKLQVAGQLNGKDFSMNLHVMQVWKKDKKGWQLLARQSAKL